MQLDSISIIIPALNEEQRIEAAVGTAREAARRDFDNYEIIIVDDGSTDRTGAIADRLAGEDARVAVIHHRKPRCLGGAYKTGLAKAMNEYVILVNGKNDISAGELGKIFALRGQADMIIPYTLNLNERSLLRRLLSKVYVRLLNTLFGLELKYYNHYVLHRRKLVSSVAISTNSYAFQSEALLKLIRRGHSYLHVGVIDTFDKGVRSKALRPGNVVRGCRFLLHMLKGKGNNRNNVIV